MIGAFWNIRGLGQPGKIHCLGDFLKNNYVDFVGFFETKIQSIDNSILQCISGKNDFSWFVLPMNNTAGEILVGLKKDMYEVLWVIMRKYGVIVSLKNNKDGFVWHLVPVYGTSYNEFKLEFIAKLH